MSNRKYVFCSSFLIKEVFKFLKLSAQVVKSRVVAILKFSYFKSFEFNNVNLGVCRMSSLSLCPPKNMCRVEIDFTKMSTRTNAEQGTKVK